MFSVGSLSAGRNSSMVELSWDPETDKTGPCLDFSIFSRQSVVRVVIVGLLYLAVFYRICRVTITKPLTGSKTEGDRERWERQKETEREMGKTEGDRERWERQKETERWERQETERWERQKETEREKKASASLNITYYYHNILRICLHEKFQMRIKYFFSHACTQPSVRAPLPSH